MLIGLKPLLLFNYRSLSEEIPSSLALKDPSIQLILKEYFSNTALDSLTFFQLKGGYSTAQNYLVQAEDQSYVLRLPPPDKASEYRKREAFSFKAAAQNGISPKIHWIANDLSAFLMDYIEGNWITTAQAKIAQNTKELANILRKVHKLPKNPIRRSRILDRLEELCISLKERQILPTELEEAMKELEFLKKKASQINIPLVTIHGDLSSRNILMTSHGIKLIDWSETCLEDPLYDLCNLALFHGFDIQEEELLLKSYLQCELSQEQKRHYCLIKNFTLACFAANLLFLAYEQLKQDSRPLSKDFSLKSWQDYANIYSEGKEDLQPQFFYEWSNCALVQLQNSLNSIAKI